METCSVLVVEDDKDIREALSDLLESEGYQVHCTANGERALSWLRGGSFPPSVILLDIMMPVMDGFQFRAAQMKDGAISSIPVIVMSASAQVAEQSAMLGARAFLKKPIDIDTVIQIISQYSSSQA